MEDAARLLQLVVNGAAAGCIYGLIALGFVLIYKATEMVNFAQGDIMMLGGFVAFSLIAHFGLNYWVGGAARDRDHRRVRLCARCGHAATRDRPAAIRRGHADARVSASSSAPYAGITWGYDSVGFDTPFTNKTVNLGGLVLGEDNLSIIVGTVLLCGVLYLFFSRHAAWRRDAGRRRRTSSPRTTWASRSAPCSR